MKWPELLIVRETPGSVEVYTSVSRVLWQAQNNGAYAEEVRYPTELPQSWKLPGAIN
jgi:hypothetical protein